MDPMQQVAAWISQQVETSLADKVVDQNELVAILNAVLADGVQDYDLRAATALLQNAQQIEMQAAQQLQAVQYQANGSGTVINSRNPLPGLIGLVGVGINAAALKQAEDQYRVAATRSQAYMVINNELRGRASWWDRLWN